MTATTPTLPAGSTLGHSYEYGLDVNIGTIESPVWQPVRRISDLQPTITPITQDSSTYDNFGSPDNDKTGEQWNVTHSVLVNRSTSTGLYTPEVEAILACTKPTAKGSAAVLHIRYYHKPESGTPNPDDAYEGFVTVGIQRGNIGNDGVEKWNITLTGKGPRIEISNPFAGWDNAVAPTITGATPTGAGEDDLVTITGAAFTGATVVKFGATNATAFTVVSDSTIVATVPAGTAGAANIKVTNATGESSAYSYTRTE